MVIACLVVAAAAMMPEPARNLLPDSLGRRARSEFLHASLQGSSTSMHWIFFTDKGVSDAAQLASAIMMLQSRRPLPGRFRRADALDLPVPDAYVNAVAATGAKIRQVSRWFNAVSVQATPVQFEQIIELACVALHRPVAHGVRAADPPPLAASRLAQQVYPQDYGLSLVSLSPLQVPELHALGLSGQGVLLAVFDSGFRLVHQAFDALVGSGRIAGRWDFVRGDSSVANDFTDAPGQDFHGTQVLSTMAALEPGEIAGPAPNATYLLAKTEDIATETPVEEDHYVAALEWADSLGARLVSSSLSYDFGYTMDGTQGISTVAANTAASRGMLLVTAMGNTGPGATSLGAPADAFDIVSVGAVDAAGEIAAFSSRGPTADGRTKPEVVAQGVSVYTVDPSQSSGYQLASGTSFSTPLTSASAALLAEAHPDWSPGMLREALMQSGDRRDAPDHSYGWGRFQLLAALDYEPTGALQIRPEGYDAADSSSWRLAVKIAAGTDRKPAEVWVYYEYVPGAQDSVALTAYSDTLWEASLPFTGEEGLRWRVRVRDSLGRVSYYPSDPHRQIELRRLPGSLQENFESGGLRWQRGGTHTLWWPSAALPYEGGYSLTDSPGDGYPENCDAWTETRWPVHVGPDAPWSLQFFTRFQFGSGDGGRVEWRSTHDTSWQVLELLTGTQNCWSLRTYALPALAGDSVSLRFRLLSDATVTGDGWHIDNVYLGGTPLDVAEGPGPADERLELLAPAPNPFNHATRVGFVLDRPAEARLLVYDLLGRRVRTLWSGGLQAGPHRFEWNGCDETGRPLASGMYLVRLEVENRAFTRKLILLK